MAKPSVSIKNRSTQLKYYYNTSRNDKLIKVKCKCGRIINKGNIIQHCNSSIHKKLIKKISSNK